MDPLSDVLSLLRPRATTSGGCDAAGAWSIAFPDHDGIKCYAVVRGECWLWLVGDAAPVRLNTGDCFMLPRGRAFRLATDLDLTPLDYKSVIPAKQNGRIVTWNGGGEFFLVGGHFSLGGEHASSLLSVLPSVVHIRGEAEKAVLRWAMDRMMKELCDGQPGGFLVAQHLAHMILVQAFRLHMAEGPKGGVGWLFALADRQMGAAITALHEDPARRWTLQDLAERAGMSRSSFAMKFKATVGVSPMEYLTRWRMLLAADRLANSKDPIAVIAQSLGYESESAFSTAFKRGKGCSPRQYGRGRSAGQDQADLGDPLQLWSSAA
jgi:AraC-like DNA-binding protein